MIGFDANAIEGRWREGIAIMTHIHIDMVFEVIKYIHKWMGMSYRALGGKAGTIAHG